MLIETDHGTRMINDTDEFPAIDVGELQDIFAIPSISEEYREAMWGTYTWNGVPVPRVSNILKECIFKDSLIEWAAKVGKKNYEKIRDEAFYIGTNVHLLIDRILEEGITSRDIDFNQYDHKMNIMRAVKNFEAWQRHLSSWGYRIDDIIAIEEPIVTPYYGGTIDAIVRINGGVYIVDFKTSRRISFEYILQTCAYMWAINSGYHPSIPYIDGIGIIRVDKYRDKFEDLFLNYSVSGQKEMIDQYIRGFGSLLMSYYNTKNMEILFDVYKRAYLRNDVLGRVIEDDK